MGVKRDISSIPAAPSSPARLPSKKPWVVTHLAHAWFERYLDSGLDEYPAAIPELPYRASYAGVRCDRQLYYHMTGITEPVTIADAWRFELGHLVGNGLGDALTVLSERTGQDWRMESEVDLRPIGINGSAHADVILYVDGKPEMVLELKSINGFGYKKAATNFKGSAAGPRSGHVLQAAMVAAALGAPKVIVAYVSLENLSPDMAQQYAPESDDPMGKEIGRFMCEWHFTTAELMPMVDAEVARIARLERTIAAGVMPARELHDDTLAAGAVVFNPKSRGAWRSTNADGEVVVSGNYPLCAYCDHRDRCVSDGDGVAPAQEGLFD